MKRLLPFAVIAAGCSPAEPPKPAEPPVVVAVVPTPQEPSKPEPPKPSPAEPFRFPTDLAGKRVEQTLLPAPPSPTVPGVTGPRSRSSPVTRGELPTAKPKPTLGPAPLTARRSPLPSAPAEGVPVAFGGEPMDLSGYRFPESKPVRVPGAPPLSAADVPPLARQWTERAATDDPSAALSADRIVRTRLLAPVLTGPLLKLVVPDPFELAEQVRPPAGPELGTTPAEVPRP